MFIRHAAPVDDSVAVWGEAGPQEPKPEPPHHPYSSTRETLAEAIGMAPNNSSHDDHVDAWLFGRGNNPAPSSAMVDVRHPACGKARIKP